MMATNWIVVIMSVMFLIAAQEFGGTVMMTISLKLVLLPKGVYYIETNKYMKNQNKIMAESTDVLFVVYIRTSHLKNTALIFFNNSQSCPKSLIRIN